MFYMEYIELFINVRLDVMMARLDNYLRDSSETKAICVMVLIGLLFIILNVVLLNVILIPAKYMWREAIQYFTSNR